MCKTERNHMLWISGLLAIVTWLAPAHALDPRVSVRVNEPFEVDGRVYPAGLLSIREIAPYSPVATLNEVRFNGESIGMLLARDSERPGTSTRDELTFSRGPAGHLVLMSVTLRGERERTLGSVRESATTVAPAVSRGPLVAAVR